MYNNISTAPIASNTASNVIPRKYTHPTLPPILGPSKGIWAKVGEVVEQDVNGHMGTRKTVEGQCCRRNTQTNKHIY